jgi:putative oxidoreductase
MATNTAFMNTSSHAVRTERSRAGTIALWSAQIVAVALFLLAGSSKLAGAPPMVQMFNAIGVGQWFRYLTGTIEVSGAILLLVPSLARFGAALLVPTMIGAVVTHLFVIGGNPAPALVLLVLTSAIAVIRWRDR